MGRSEELDLTDLGPGHPPNEPTMMSDMDVDAFMPPPDFECVVFGLPAPQGSKKHVGGGRMVESSKALRPWRLHVGNVVHFKQEGEPFDGPLLADVFFTVPKPLSAPVGRASWPMRRPDLDKLVRAVFDALTDAGVWTDDARVVDLRCGKRYPYEGADSLGEPGVVIRVWKRDGATE